MTSESAIVREFRANQPVNLEALLDRLGVSLERSTELDPAISGELERREDGSYVIRVNAYHSRNRQRFTIAHELGHYMLHRLLIGKGVDDNKAFRSEARGNFHNTKILPKHETEANQFAASLLMPAEQVREARERCRSLEELAQQFGVSTAAMEVRMKYLKLPEFDHEFA